MYQLISAGCLIFLYGFDFIKFENFIIFLILIVGWFICRDIESLIRSVNEHRREMKDELNDIREQLELIDDSNSDKNKFK